MGVGTSLGKNFDDLFHFHQNQYDPDKFPANDEEKPDIQKNVDKQISGDIDPDMTRNPLEILPGVEPTTAMDPMKMMEQKLIGSDPSNIYNDLGDIVDTDMKSFKSIPLLKPMSLIQSESTFNEVDQNAPDLTPNQYVEQNFPVTGLKSEKMSEFAPLQISPSQNSNLNERLRINEMKPNSPSPMPTDEFQRNRILDIMKSQK